MRNLFKDQLTQFWFNAQKMEAEERKNTIKYIINLNKYTSNFIDHQAKFFMAQLIDNSECYFNGKGYQTKVKEFEKLNWYNEQGNLDYNRVMN
jgi:hypothetical protein